MAVNKKHAEFHTLDMNTGWETPLGYPNGIEQKILSGALDEANKRGTRTRLLRFAPGVFTTKPFVHEYWEEVFLVSGDLICGSDDKGQKFTITANNGATTLALGDIDGAAPAIRVQKTMLASTTGQRLSLASP